MDVKMILEMIEECRQAQKKASFLLNEIDRGLDDAHLSDAEFHEVMGALLSLSNDISKE